MQQPALPSETIAGEIVRQALDEQIVSTRRFPTGLCHFVYEVETISGRAIVARIATCDTQHLLASGVAWSALLRPRGVPLPAMLAAELESRSAGFAYVLLERLPGSDLGLLYGTLSAAEKQQIAAALVEAQSRVATLPPGAGFGYAERLGAALPHRTWSGVVQASLERSRSRSAATGVIGERQIERIERALATIEPYLRRQQPQAFLDDTTTKNVIVDNGQLSGIVDVDVVCYGDPLWTVALTQTSLLTMGCDIDYIAFWLDLLGADAKQRQAVQIYSAVFCLDFLSELGQRFNRETAIPVEPQKVARLSALFEGLLSSA